jgi:DNA-binding MarR family transcriptional regulator
MSSKTTPKVGAAAPRTPQLPALLSQLLIAFTIELDNEFEHRMPHKTTSFGSTEKQIRTAWLGSFVLWANGMRLIPEEGITVAELERQARTNKIQLPGLERWGYITVAPDPTDRREKIPERDWLVRPTANGLKAQEIWRSLPEVIEHRWKKRFGHDEIDSLRKSLSSVLSRIDLAMPNYLPILDPGLSSQITFDETSSTKAHTSERLAKTDLITLLAKTLLAFTIEFEFDWKISLPISANGLRLLSDKPTPIVDLPRLSGISKEGIAFITGWLARGGLAVIEADATRKGKAIRLTPLGQKAREAYLQRLELTESRWRERSGDEEIAHLRKSLLTLLNKSEDKQPVLAQALTPYPDGWRARKPYVTQTSVFLDDPAGSLPQQPMVLHRGGYPDGS